MRATRPDVESADRRLADESRLRQQPAFRAEVLDGELILYNPATTRAVYCSETAGLVWRLCDGARTVADIVELVREAYPEAAAEIEIDVRAALGRLLAEGALARG